MIKIKHIETTENKKVYFVSDHHFGLDMSISSREREQKFVQWLDEIKNNTEALFILGDMFDFWYEYKQAVPKGFVRVLGKLAEFTDAGIRVYFFTGNHDMWMRDYFEKELNIKIFFNPEIFYINDKKFLIGHGDGLGPGDKNYKHLKNFFRNRFAQWAYRWLHPDIGLAFGQNLSRRNKLVSSNNDTNFKGEDKEWLYLYAKEYLKKDPDVQYFVFGHRHLPLEIPLNDTAFYYNTGDWLMYFSYVEFDGDKMKLHKFNSNHPHKGMDEV